MNLVRRDDVDLAIIEALQEQSHGMKIVFAGQNPELLPDYVLEAIVAHNKEFEKRLVNGRCLDCETEHPRPWPPIEYLAPGWRIFTDTVTGDLTAIQCPKCDKKESELDLQK